MEKVIAFAKYLEALDVDINELSFEEAVNLHTEVERLVRNKFKR